MNRQKLINYVEQKFQKNSLDSFHVGDTIRVNIKITEGDSSRIQVFEGVVIGFKGSGAARMFTVRKISFGIGVEKVFPLKSPNIEKIKVVRSGHVRRAKLYYLRDRAGKAARLEEKGWLGGEAETNAAGTPSSETPPVSSSPEELATAKEK